MICFLRRANTSYGKNVISLLVVYTAEAPGICKYDDLPEALRERAYNTFWTGAERLTDENTVFVGTSIDDFFEELEKLEEELEDPTF